MPTIEELQAELDSARTRISELNSEAKGHRLDAKEARQQATEAQAALTKAQERIVNAELKVAATAAGAVDVSDVLALLDRRQIKLDDAGEVTNAAELIEEFKRAKPNHFSAGRSTSNTRPTPPKPGETQPKKVAEMTDEEVDQAIRQRAWRA